MGMASDTTEKMLCHDSVVYRSTRSHHSLPFSVVSAPFPLEGCLFFGVLVFVSLLASFEVVEFGWICAVMRLV